MPGVDKRAVFERIGYKPHAKQWLFHNSQARFKVPTCGRRFGKSIMAAAELFVNDRLNIWMPNLIFWIVGPKYIHGAKEFRYVMRFLKKHKGPDGKRSLWDYADSKSFNVKQGDMHVTLPWGTEIVVMSAQHKDTLVGEGLAGIIVSEAAKQDYDVWEQFLQPGLTDLAREGSWAAFPSTPEGFNWYHGLHEFGKEKSTKRQPEYESWNFPSWDNPYVFPNGRDDPEIKRIENAAIAGNMEEAFWQEYGASFRSVVGLIYGREWDDELHIYEEYFDKTWAYHSAWANYTAVDFGFTNPFVVLDIQVDPMDNVYIWREHYLSKHSTPQHIEKLSGRSDPPGYHVAWGTGDPAYPDGIEQLSINMWPLLADPDCKDWQRGIDEVKRLLIGEDGLPHVFVSRNCPMTIWEFQNYRVKKASSDQVNAQERAASYADHAMDAFRYWVMHKFVLYGGGMSLRDAMSKGEDEQETEAEAGLDKGFFTHSGESMFTMDSVL